MQSLSPLENNPWKICSNKLLLLSVLVVCISCKTREDIRREKTVDNLSVQNADLIARLQGIEEKVSKHSGKIEETEHRSEQIITSKINSFNDRLRLLEESNKTMQEQIKAQSNYIKSINKSLEKLVNKRSSKRVKRPKKGSSKIDQAHFYYRNKNYDNAQEIYEKLLENEKKLSASQHAHILHNMGIIKYIKKQNEDAVAYLSKLYTKYPKRTFNKTGLLFLAKSFRRLKSKNEARQIIRELVRKYPKSSQAKQAKEILKKL